jgi:L-fuculose-phosphate aldolase
MSREQELRAEICEIGRRVYDRFFVAANDGNISAKLDDETILVSPTGVSKGFMRPDDILKVDFDGRVLDATTRLRPSSETPMHLAVYRARPDVAAAVHAHPPTATGFGVAGLALDAPILPEMILTVGFVPLVPYGTPAGVDLQNSVAPYLGDYDAFLLANHGALTLGENLTQAYFKMESIELYARVWLTARTIGQENHLSAAEIEKLLDTRERLGGRGKNPLADARKRA